MNTLWQKARRYHWFGDLDLADFVEEPHTGIASQARLSKVLNLTAKESDPNRQIAVDLIQNRIELVRDFKILTLHDRDFKTHPVVNKPINFESPHLKKSFDKIFTEKPKTFQEIMILSPIQLTAKPMTKRLTLCPAPLETQETFQ